MRSRRQGLPHLHHRLRPLQILLMVCGGARDIGRQVGGCEGLWKKRIDGTVPRSLQWPSAWTAFAHICPAWTASAQAGQIRSRLGIMRSRLGKCGDHPLKLFSFELLSSDGAVLADLYG